MITTRIIIQIGFSQLVCWGIYYYLIGVFGDLIMADTGWSRTVVYGGFSLGLGVMGLVSAATGRLIDRFGGGRVMAAGSVFGAVGCCVLAASHHPYTYYAGWIWLGLAMRMTLYDAAFASLARIGGPNARRPMAQVTLLGGLASTVFWPLGHALAEMLTWRIALIVYACLSVLTLPLHLAIPAHMYTDGGLPERNLPAGHPETGNRRAWKAFLYALVFAVMAGLNSSMSAHMIGLLKGLGLTATVAVSIASLRGIGQSSSRLAEVMFGKRLSPVDLNLMATLVLPICFAIGLGGMYYAPAVVFTFLYGAANGILSITRGTLPLVLFDLETYGAHVGILLVPSFIFSAAAPLLFAEVMDRSGARGGMYLLILLGSVVCLTALGIKVLSLRGKPACLPG